MNFKILVRGYVMKEKYIKPCIIMESLSISEYIAGCGTSVDPVMGINLRDLITMTTCFEAIAPFVEGIDGYEVDYTNQTIVTPSSMPVCHAFYAQDPAQVLIMS